MLVILYYYIMIEYIYIYIKLMVISLLIGYIRRPRPKPWPGRRLGPPLVWTSPKLPHEGSSKPAARPSLSSKPAQAVPARCPAKLLQIVQLACPFVKSPEAMRGTPVAEAMVPRLQELQHIGNIYKHKPRDENEDQKIVIALKLQTAANVLFLTL